MQITQTQRGFGLTGIILAVVMLLAVLTASYLYFNTDDGVFDLDASPEFSETTGNCEHPTAHYSCIFDGIDSILVGSWILESQTITAQGHTIPSKFVGTTLHFDHEGRYTEDYSTETTDTQVVNHPDGSLTSKCKTSGVISGEYDSMRYYDPSDPNNLTQLRALKTSGVVEVSCLDGNGEYVHAGKNTASIPLGKGQQVDTESGTRVVYDYTVTSDGEPIKLILTQKNTVTGVILRSVYRRKI